MARATGRKVKEAPKLPPELRPVWWTFLALHRARSAGGFGVNPIQFTEIEAWCRLNRVALEPWEVDVIGMLDDAYLESSQE